MIDLVVVVYIVGFELVYVQLCIQVQCGIQLVFVVFDGVVGFMMVDQVYVFFQVVCGQCFNVEIGCGMGEIEVVVIVYLYVVLVWVLVFYQYVMEVVCGGEVDDFFCFGGGGCVFWFGCLVFVVQVY